MPQKKLGEASMPRKKLGGMPMPRGQMNVTKDIEFKRVGGQPLMLDVYRPDDQAGPVPAVLWICGGGWKGMSKNGAPRVAAWITDHGFAVVAFNYRVVSQAPSPAQIQDCKAAVRWTRANAAEFGLDADRIGAWGDSAGGHLAALLGTSAGVAEFDADGHRQGVSSAVQAVAAFYPPTDFEHFPRDNREVPALIGGPIDENLDAARAASPITYVNSASPPHLLVHGDADKIVPIDQSYRLRDALSAQGVYVHLHVMPGVGHDGSVVYNDPQVRQMTLDFFRRWLMRV